MAHSSDILKLLKTVDFKEFQPQKIQVTIVVTRKSGFNLNVYGGFFHCMLYCLKYDIKIC